MNKIRIGIAGMAISAKGLSWLLPTIKIWSWSLCLHAVIRPRWPCKAACP